VRRQLFAIAGEIVRKLTGRGTRSESCKIWSEENKKKEEEGRK
jgi:hypothetical protein